MNSQDEITYRRVEQAIKYLQENFQKQPKLEEVAEVTSLSPYHFQRVFSEWAGVSPKKFLQYISIGHAKKVLSNAGSSLMEANLESGLSGTGRLHDLFINIEGMTPGEYKNGGALLSINYQFFTTHFGDIIVASTAKGICHLAFAENREEALLLLQAQFPKAAFCQKCDQFHINAVRIFDRDWNQLDQVKLHLKGTDFQLKVWECLLKIPMGKLTTYGHIAHHIKKPKASRAVGTAIGSNPVAFLIPCHRVIQSSGLIGGYMWGPTRKKAMIGWEAAYKDAGH
ncbi:methylated-DNA--[protein]-cysteine S-methyltransferase [Echinicola sediminis]